MVRPAPLHMYISLNFEIMVEHLFDEFLTLTQLGPYGELCLCEGGKHGAVYSEKELRFFWPGTFIEILGDCLFIMSHNSLL